MYFLKIVLLAIAFVGFGFFSFQKGREYERMNSGSQKNIKKK